MLEYFCLNYICSETVFVIGFKYPLGFQNSFNSSETAPLDSSSEDTSFKEHNHLCSLKTVHKNFLQANRDDMVRWYKLTFAISRKRDSRSLQCFTTTINLCPKDLMQLVLGAYGGFNQGRRWFSALPFLLLLAGTQNHVSFWDYAKHWFSFCWGRGEVVLVVAGRQMTHNALSVSLHAPKRQRRYAS